MACIVPDGRVHGANPSFCEIVGRTETELSGVRFVDLTHLDDRDRYQDLLESLRNGTVQSFETTNRYVSGRGDPVWCQTSVYAMGADLGEPGYFVALVRDITEWQSAEEQNSRLFGSPLALVFIVGRDGFFRRVSAGYETLLGWTEQELLSLPFSDFVHPDDLAAVNASIKEIGSGSPEVINQDIRTRCKDGTYRWLMGNFRPNFDEGVTYGIAVDITDRKRAEDALRESERRTRLIIDTAYEAFISIDDGGRILEWNAQATRVFGWRREQVVGRLLTELIIPERYRTAHVNGLEHWRSTGEGPLLGKRTEIEALRHDGSELLVELTISPATIGDTSVFNAFLRDITERKRAEKTLADAKEEAERAREDADRASRAKSDFLSGMSHELRTPLNAILGFAQLMALDRLSSEQDESVEQILNAGQHLLQLIDELLDVARIEQGSVSLSIEPVQLDLVVRQALDLVRSLAQASDIRIRFEAPDFHHHASADRERLLQVLTNLLSNAIKYNRHAGGVTVSCETIPSGRLRITVADTGPGIPAAMMDRLFLPFDRLGAERTAVQGTGIGLSISKRLVELMGGEIGVESEIGEGSRFWVELDPANAPEVQHEPDTNYLSCVGGERTVLYVEDNPSNVRLVELILARRPGTRLVSATQGQLAVDLARQHRPQLVLLDVNLPDIDGDEVLRQLQADLQTSNIPVVVLSAEATPGRVERFLAAGASAYLTKPLDVHRLLEIVDAIAAEPGPAAGPAGSDSEKDPLDQDVIGGLRQLLDTPRGRLSALVTDFFHDGARCLAEMREAAARGDASSVMRRAHDLRGSTGMYGARLLPVLCGRLELLAASGVLTGAEASLEAIEAELERVYAALQLEFPAP